MVYHLIKFLQLENKENKEVKVKKEDPLALFTPILLVLLVIFLLVGCKGQRSPGQPAPLPGGGEGPEPPRGVCPERVHKSLDGHFRMTINYAAECESTLAVGSSPDLSVTWWQDLYEEVRVVVFVSSDGINLVAEPGSKVHSPFNRVALDRGTYLKKGVPLTVTFGPRFGTWTTTGGVSPDLVDIGVPYLAIAAGDVQGFTRWISPTTCIPNPWLVCNTWQFAVRTDWKVRN